MLSERARRLSAEAARGRPGWGQWELGHRRSAYRMVDVRNATLGPDLDGDRDIQYDGRKPVLLTVIHSLRSLLAIHFYPPPDGDQSLLGWRRWLGCETDEAMLALIGRMPPAGFCPLIQGIARGAENNWLASEQLPVGALQVLTQSLLYAECVDPIGRFAHLDDGHVVQIDVLTEGRIQFDSRFRHAMYRTGSSVTTLFHSDDAADTEQAQLLGTDLARRGVFEAVLDYVYWRDTAFLCPPFPAVARRQSASRMAAGDRTRALPIDVPLDILIAGTAER